MESDGTEETADYTAEQVSDRLQAQLSARRISVHALWKLINEGSERHLGAVVNGDAKPRPAMLDRIAAALGLTARELLSTDPFVRKETLPLTAWELDVLYAAGAFDRSTIQALLRQAVTEFVQAQSDDPDVAKILDAMQHGRARRSRAPDGG